MPLQFDYNVNLLELEHSKLQIKLLFGLVECC